MAEDRILQHAEYSESLTVKTAPLAGGPEQSMRQFLAATDQNRGDIELDRTPNMLDRQ